MYSSSSSVLNGAAMMQQSGTSALRSKPLLITDAWEDLVKYFAYEHRVV
jgi:hypothetical protein